MHCCGSLWTYNPNHEMCCSQSHEIVPRTSRCGSTTYNKCEKVCCDGELSDKFQNSVAMSCCGRNTYDKKKQTCCDGNTYEKFACKEYQLWEGYYQHEVKCSEDGNIRYVVTEEECKAVRNRICKELYLICIPGYITQSQNTSCAQNPNNYDQVV